MKHHQPRVVRASKRSKFELIRSGSDGRWLPVIAATSLAVAIAQIAHAADPQSPNGAASASTTAAANTDASSLSEIVVTASVADKSRLKSSISVTDIKPQLIEELAPRSEAEVFRLIPGIRAEDTAGPGGNSNITVRGLPIVTGGSEFVQLQEDGLPTVLFGDMNFGNNDYWIRYDDSVGRVEAVRGGSASTLASQAPGAVINYVSKTGEHEGGEVSLTRAVNYDETRVDFGYGEPVSDTVRFYVGGFVKGGRGPTNIDYNAEQGYQLKANITKEFNDGHGFIRLNFKRLDDKEPTYSNMPSLATISGNTIGSFSAFPGFDPRSQSNQSIYNQTFQVLNNNGTLANVSMQGIHPKATAIGGEFSNEFGDHFSVDDKFRYTQQNGVFITQFVNVAPTSSVIGSTVNGKTVGSIVYANGPQAGQAFTGAFLNNNPNIDTNMSDMGNWVNDLHLNAKYQDAVGKLNAAVGWFHMVQNIAQDWHVNPSYSVLSGNNPAQLDLIATDGTQLTAAGQAGFNNNWGSCCARAYNLSYADDAPYLSLDHTLGGFDLDGSLRVDTVRATGASYGGVAGPTLSVSDGIGTAQLPSLVAGGTPEVLDYQKQYTSWSLGALYAFNNDTSVFARVSRGARFNADRLILSGYFNADGTPNSSGQPKLTNVVLQQEVGVKNRGDAPFGGHYNAEATVFRAQTADNNYDLTNQIAYANVYHSYGVEMDGALRFGHFFLTGDVTYTSAAITQSNDPTTLHKTPLATPKFIYLFSPTYDLGYAAGGLTIDGQSGAYTDNTDAYLIEGQTFVNAFVKIRPYEGLELSFNVNNLFDTIGYRGRGSLVNTSATTGVFQNSAVLGRTMTVTATYRF